MGRVSEGFNDSYLCQCLQSMRDGSWNQLPAELLERVLSIVPVPDLCRLRSVCKMWNSLICSPAFGKKFVSKGANTGAFFVVNLHVRCRTAPIPLINRLSMFDLNAKRWYNFEHELPAGLDYDVPAMDGGLVCKFVASLTAEQHQQSIQQSIRMRHSVICPVLHTFIIFNLCGGTFKALPAPPLLHIHVPSMNLRLFDDSVSNTFKIFLLNPRTYVGEPPGEPWMCVYESSANQWRILSSPPIGPNPLAVHVRSVLFQGLLYVLVYSLAGSINRLYSFNYPEDAWEDTRVQFQQDKVLFCECSDLVVSDNRLFLMTQHLVFGCECLPELRRSSRLGRNGCACCC